MNLLSFTSAVLLIIIQTSCNFASTQSNNGLKHKSQDENLRYVNNFGDQLLLKSIISIDKYNNELNIGKEVYNKDIDYLEFEKDINTLINENPFIVDSLLDVILSRKNKKELLEHISIWCSSYIIIDQMWNPNVQVFCEKYIYEIPTTTHLVSDLLLTSEQSWSSLSSSQIYELPYKVCNLLLEMNTKERTDFFILFYQKAYVDIE